MATADPRRTAIVEPLGQRPARATDELKQGREYYRRQVTRILGPAALRLPPGAACKGKDPRLFFPEDGDGAEAKAICSRCPIRRACYELAEARREPFGIWGGEDFAERPASRSQAAHCA
jgi:hypothetical protein